MNIRNSNPHRRAPARPAPDWRLRPVALALACMGAGPALAQAQLPSWNNFLVRGGVVSVGTPTAEGTRLGITQSSQRAIVDWQGFSIGQGNTVTIAQPNVSSVLLNRVTGAEASTIAGSLNANGRVFLVNPNGVLFTGTSSVNVGGLVASALKMSTSDDAFMSGTERIEFAQDPNVVNGVTHNGSITAQGLGGTVALVGATVTNNGSIVAQGGTAAMASGETVTVDFAGDGLTTFKLTPGAYGTVANGGLVQADGGRVLLLATSTGEVTQGVVNTGGLLRANSLASRNGEIVLDSGNSDAGVTINSGALMARGEGAGQTGGSIEVKGRTVLVQPFFLDAVSVAGAPLDLNAHIDASGTAGGGKILLQATALPGQPQTGAIAVAAGSVLRADATGTGDGGDVRVMAERTLRAYGSLSARGGP
ncbi:MAG: filamentous hemagglutinin N-terminal domain-containing protein, partial [Gammaproteobacteria bacterium]|nr:filamentous hemagglutinin N-terminal domain-containing protein [Gammaproteobacteria bacterium]